MYDLSIQQASDKCKEYHEALKANGIFNNVKEYPTHKYLKCIEVEVKRAFSPGSKEKGWRVFYDLYIKTRYAAIENQNILRICSEYNWSMNGKSHECKDITTLLATLQEIENRMK